MPLVASAEGIDSVLLQTQSVRVCTRNTVCRLPPADNLLVIMLLYYSTQVISNRMLQKNQTTEISSCATNTSQQNEGREELIRPKKLSNPILESHSHRGLHRELLVSHRWGLLPGEKPELKRVLEQRRLEQHRDREQALQPPSDLEKELRKRRQKLMEYEQEELRRRMDLQNVPEFVRVRDNLRHITIPGY